MAQAIHKQMVTECFERLRVDNHPKKCECEACRTSRRVEHMRWNAYMRSIGYQLPPDNHMEYEVKLARAQYHYRLVPYYMLPDAEKEKDRTIQNKS